LYFKGSHNIYQYTDNFGYSDALVRVQEGGVYVPSRSTKCSAAPGPKTLWLSSSRFALATCSGVFPAPAPVHAPVLFASAPAPVLLAVIPMEVDRPDTHFPTDLLPVRSCQTPRPRVPHYIRRLAHGRSR
jgi:hypothetical protein